MRVCLCAWMCVRACRSTCACRDGSSSGCPSGERQSWQGNTCVCVCVRGCVFVRAGARVPVGMGPVQVVPPERGRAGRVPAGGHGQSRDCSPKDQSFQGLPPWSLQSPRCCMGTSGSSIGGITELVAETFELHPRPAGASPHTPPMIGLHLRVRDARLPQFHQLNILSIHS